MGKFWFEDSGYMRDYSHFIIWKLMIRSVIQKHDYYYFYEK